ncbi:heterokaryon incompatibility, partial [Mollisia scopiformis]
AFSEEAQPKYEALSYVWGSEENPATICVCDKSDDSPFSTRKTWTSMPITRNLEVALRHLRYSVRRRVLWVDAICINQRDDEEKGRQLPRMGDIYQRARSVAIWLG